MKLPRPLATSFYNRKADIVAEALIGKTLIHDSAQGVMGGRIIETEAYLAKDDPACHASRGETPRNRTMFGPPGRLYVYTIHARHCLNAVTQIEGKASAVLIRAIEPLWGEELMAYNRGYYELMRLCRGPGMLCEALDIDLRHDGTDITTAEGVWIGKATKQISEDEIGVSSRIGISQGTGLPLRFFVRDCKLVSGPRWLNKGI